jgi:hypothetical protein
MIDLLSEVEKDPRREKDLFLALAPIYVPVLSALLLFSCGAARSAQEIMVQVPEEFTGTVKIDPCESKASVDHVLVDAKGLAATSACPKPGQRVTLLIVRAGKTYRITPENVAVLRAGDGLPVRIQASVPPR